MKFPFIKKHDVTVRGVNNVFYSQAFIDVIVDSFRHVANSDDYQPVVTSGTDGKHSRFSCHYDGDALDFRLWGFGGTQRRLIAIHLIVNLKTYCPAQDWRIVLHSTHLHLQASAKNIRPNSKGVYR